VRVGYLTGTYPRASDTFIQREVAGVRAAGVEVSTYAVRRPGPEHLVGPEQVAEHAATSYLLPASVAEVLGAQARAARRWPKRWREAVALAARTRPEGAKSLAYQGIYLAEAAIVAERALADGVDHLHNHFADQSGTVTMLAARLADIPFSMTVHGPHIFFAPERWALGVKAGEAAFVACISEFARSQVMIFAPESAWPRLHVVHCGVVPSLFCEPIAAAGRFRVLSVGRLAAEKGLPVLLRAVAAAGIDGLDLVLVGDGPDREALQSLASSLSVPARFVGSQGQAAVRDLLRDADLLVSAGFAEGIPTALMEAMAARLPVVASRIAGVPELVTDGVHGRLVAPGSEVELAQALTDLHALGPEGRRVMGDAGRAVVEKWFDAEIESAKLARLFQS
jgi:glycosyltransferase involved in cell wall biosynthesis